MSDRSAHAKAHDAAHAEAEAFFMENPRRTFHVQSSRPLEMPTWNENSHKHWKQMLCFWDRSTGKSIVRRWPLRSEVPLLDEEALLFEIWLRRLDAKEGEIANIVPADHARLLEKAGLSHGG